MRQKRIYLDNNATTAIDHRVLEVLLEELSGEPSNPSSMHSFGQKAKALLVRAASEIASFFEVKSNEVFFNSGATEGLNTLLRGLPVDYSKGHIISSNLEHPAVFFTLKELEKKGCSVTFLNAEKGKSSISLDQVQSALQSNTCLISLMAANNETGGMTDIEAIGRLAERIGIAFIVDGVALLGKGDLKIPQGLTAICFSGHKIHAPKGIGITIARKSLKWSPLIVGGPQQSGKRAGTENMAGILAFCKAVALLKNEGQESIQRMKSLRDRLESGLRQNLSDVIINGFEERVCNTSNISFLGVDGESLLFNLDRAGIAVSHGSACMSGGLEPSRVLLNMGLPSSIAHYLKETWEKTFDIPIILQSMHWNTLCSQIDRRNFHLAQCTESAFSRDPLELLQKFEHKNSPRNHSGWSSPTYQQKVASIRHSRSLSERQQLLRDAEECLHDALPFIPIVNRQFLYATSLVDYVIDETGCVDFRWAKRGN